MANRIELMQMIDPEMGLPDIVDVSVKLMEHHEFGILMEVTQYPGDKEDEEKVSVFLNKATMLDLSAGLKRMADSLKYESEVE
jgi:hypothetical protein